MAFASFTNADRVLQQIASQTDGDGALTINGSTLNQWLTTLQRTSTHVRQELQQQVAGHAETTFLPAYHYNNQVYQRADLQVQDALTSSQTFLNSASIMTTQTTQASSDTRSLADQAHHSHTIVTTLKSLVEISKDLDQVDTFLSQGAIVDATRQLLVVLDRQANEQADGDGLAARYHLRTRAERYKTLLANTIHDGLTQSIVLTTNDGDTVLDLSIQHSIAFAHGTANTTLVLKDLLMASTLLQTQYVELASIQRHIVKKLITPLLLDSGDTQLLASHGTVQLTVDELHDPAVSKLHLMMTPPTTTTSHHDNDDTNPLKAYEARCSTSSDRMQHTLVIVRFVFEHLFGPEPHWLAMRQLFGRLFLPDVFQLVIKSILAPAIPSTTTSTDILTRLASLGSSAAVFEQQCIVDYAGITPPPPSSNADDDNFPLARYVSQLDKHVAHQRHSRILHDARQVMLRQIYDTEPDTTEGIHITQTPRILRAMIQELTAEAASLEQQHYYPKTSQTLRNTTHDILILYMSIMPSIHRPEFLQHADRAIVFRNDCYWLAIHTQHDTGDDIRSKLEQLGDLWQKVVVAQLMNTVAIVLDRTEEWQLDGTSQLQQQQQQQSSQGSMALDTKKQPIGPSQQHQQQQQQAMSLENAIAIIITQVQSLANAIKPVVTTTLYNTTLIELVNGVVGRLTDDLLAMADISAEASHTMALALNGVAQLANVFLSNDGGTGVSEIQLRQWIPRWQGFWMVKDMLELTMADILTALHRGDLCMFSHQELAHLVCALFADTPRRDETLRIIKTSDLNGSTTTRDIASLLDPVIESPPPPQPPMVKHSPHDRESVVTTASPHIDKDMATSSSRLVFDMEEETNVDDGWDQEGWSDDDDLDFTIAPVKKDSTPTNQDFKLAQAEQMGIGKLDMDTTMNDDFDSGMNMPLDKPSGVSLEEGDEFDPGMNVSMDQPMAEDNELDSGMTMPLDDQDNYNSGVGNLDKADSTLTNQEQHQETLPFDHPIGVESDKEDKFDHEMDIPMEKSADISLEDDYFKDDSDSGMNMPLDAQENGYLDLDNEDHFGKVEDTDMNQDIRKDYPALDRITGEHPNVDDDKDDVLDSGAIGSLDLKNKQYLGMPLENEDSYNKNEPMEASHEQHEDSRSPEIEQLVDESAGMNVDMNDALDHGMNTHLVADQLDKEDEHAKDQVEEKQPATAQEYHEGSQSPQHEYPIGETSEMDTAMTDNFDTTTDKPQDKLLDQSLKFDGGSDFNIPPDNQEGVFVDDDDDNLDSSRIMALDDKVSQRLDVSLEHDDNTGKDDNTHITQADHEDVGSLSPQNEHTIGEITDLVAGKNDDIDSGMMLSDTSADDHDTLLNRPQDDKDKHALGVSLEDENDSGKNGQAQIHQEHYEDSGSSPSKQAVKQSVNLDTIKDNDGIPLENALGDLMANVDHGEEMPVDDQDTRHLEVDAKDNHDKDAHTETTQDYHQDSQLPIHTTSGDINSNKEMGYNGIDLDTRTDTTKEKEPLDTWNHGSLNNDSRALDMLLDDDEGGGWSDADHDIDLDLNLLSHSSLVEPFPPPASMDHATNNSTAAATPPMDTATTKTKPSIPSPQKISPPVTSPRSYSQPASLSPPVNPLPLPSLLQHQPSPVVKTSASPTPSPSLSKFSMIEDTMMDDNFDDEGDGGWSDAENIMEFDTTIPTIAPPTTTPQEKSTNTVDQSVAKTNAHPSPGAASLSTKHSNNNDTNASNNSKTTTTLARSNLMMDLVLEDDDDIGGGWSDADEELF